MHQNLPFPFSLRLSRQEFLCCTLFALVSFLTGLCAASLPGIGGSSEAREAHVIRLMVEQGDYVLPSRNGIIPSKPPLFHWVGVGISRVLGQFSPWTARMPSLAAAAVILWIIMALGAQSGGENPDRRMRMMVWSGIILASSYEFEKLRTVAMVDMIFSCCTVLALAPIFHRLLMEEQGAHREASIPSADYSAFFVFSGLAVLAKGPIGLAVPLLMVVPLLSAVFGLKRALIQLARPRLGWVMFVLLVVPWYWFAALRQSEAFLGKQLVFENLKRFTGGEYVNQQPWWFYVPAFLRASFPWSLCFLFGLSRWFSPVYSREGEYRHSSAVLIRHLCLAIGLLFVFFSLASGKRDSYLLPLLPWLSLATAPVVLDLLEKLSMSTRARVFSGMRRVVIGVLCLLLMFLVGISLISELRLTVSDPLLGLVRGWLIDDLPIAAVGASLIALLLPLVRRFELRGEWRLAAGALTLVGVFSIALALGVSVRSRLKNFEPVAAAINQKAGSAPLQVVRIVRDEFFDGILYYLRREVSLVPPDQFPQRCGGFALMRHDQWLEMKDRLPAARVVAIYTELDDQIRGRDRNQKVLLECP